MVIGRARATGTPGHAAPAERPAKGLGETGEFQRITMNRSRSASAVDAPAGGPNDRRPGIIAIGRDYRIRAFEIASGSDIAGGVEEGLNDPRQRLNGVRVRLPLEYQRVAEAMATDDVDLLISQLIKT